MSTRKIQKGDEVKVIAGRDKGKVGKVMGFVGDKKVIVEGVNVCKKHLKPKNYVKRKNAKRAECANQCRVVVGLSLLVDVNGRC